MEHFRTGSLVENEHEKPRVFERLFLTDQQNRVITKAIVGKKACIPAASSESDNCKRTLHLVRKGETLMTEKAQRTFKALNASTERYSGTVQKKLSKKSRRKPNPAVVASAAKYYVALKKLADG